MSATPSESAPAIDPFLSDAYFENAEGVLAEIREHDPVHYVEPLDAW